MPRGYPPWWKLTGRFDLAFSTFRLATYCPLALPAHLTAPLRWSFVPGCGLKTTRCAVAVSALFTARLAADLQRVPNSGEVIAPEGNGFEFVPSFVIAALFSFVPDSPEYFFWSGKGKLHTRTSKWGERLQRLHVYAGVRVSEVEKVRRSGGKLKDTAETVWFLPLRLIGGDIPSFGTCI